jgi:quinoprotein glucose dehydrogenase
LRHIVGVSRIRRYLFVCGTAAGICCVILGTSETHGVRANEAEHAKTAHASIQKGETDWPVSGGTWENIHYSNLTQINVGNVSKLKEVWTFDPQEKGGLETAPIMLDGVLYTYGPLQEVVALDPTSGKVIWKFDPGVGNPGNHRGLTYWQSGNDKRILATVTHFLYAIDATNGHGIPSFGENGRIDLRENLGRDPKLQSVSTTSAGVIYKDLIILGDSVPEALPTPPGDIRAYDVRTGKLRWSFHTIPHPGEYGYDTWPKDAWTYSGAANNWAGMAVDPKLGIVYAPTGSAATDWYGADRVGDDLFANTLLALNAETGERIWHFQGVRHDLWDRDFPSSPTLVTVRRSGKQVAAVVQTSKQGFLFLFDRANGKPLFPIEYRKVPASTVPGEVAAPEQPFPTKPAPFARQLLTEDLLTNRTPEAHQWAVQEFRKIRSDGQFVPNSVGKETMMFPGMNGGAEWGGSAFDPETHVIYINSNDVGLTEGLMKQIGGSTGRATYLSQCSGCHGENRAGSPPEFPSLVNIGSRLNAVQITNLLETGRGRMPSFPNLAGTAEPIRSLIRYLLSNDPGADTSSPSANSKVQYDTTGYRNFVDPQGYPANAPPWGTLNAINLDTGDYVWKIPFGQYPELAAQGLTDTGSPNYGGSVVTAGGVLFIGATAFDKKFRAYDKSTGKLLWETTLPFSANATPITYEVNGRQYVVIAAGGIRDPKTPPRGVYVAFALPQ